MPSHSAEAKARRDQNRVRCLRCLRRGHKTVDCTMSVDPPAPVPSTQLLPDCNTFATVTATHSSVCSSSSTSFATGACPSYSVMPSAFAGHCPTDEATHSPVEKRPDCDRSDPEDSVELEPVTSANPIEPIRPCTPPSASSCASNKSASRSIWDPIPSPLIPGRDVGNMSCEQINHMVYGEEKHMKCPWCDNEGSTYFFTSCKRVKC